jgi:AcrR family transcriptional regulator
VARPTRQRIKKPAGQFHHGTLADALVEAALRLSETQGPTAWTVREAARLAGVSAGAPYKHFADRAALVAAVAERGFGELDATLEAASAGQPHPLLKLRAIGQAHLGFALERPARYRLMFGAEAPEKGRHEGLHRAATIVFQRVVGVVQACQGAGVVRAGDPHLVALGLFASTHGLAEVVMTGQLDGMGIPAAQQEVGVLGPWVADFLLFGLRGPERA